MTRLLALLAVPLLTWLQLVRRPTDPPAWDSLYVEDGQVFLSQAVSQNFLDSLATSYVGYLHTIARAVTEPATWFALEDAPLVMALLASLAVALMSLYVFRASEPWIESPVLRGALAIAVALAPVTARDISATVCHLHFYLIYVSSWAVVCPRRSPGWLAASTAVVLIAVLSDPLTGVLLPIALVVAARAREREAWIVPAAIVFGLLVQLVLRDEGAERVGGVDAATVPRIFAERVTSSLLAGDSHLEDLFGGRTGSPFAWASLALVALAVGLGAWRLRGRRRWLLGGGAALCVAFFLIPVIARGTDLLVPDVPWALGASRYMYIPVLFLLTGLLALADRPAPGAPFRLRELAAVLLVLVPIAIDYRAPHRTEGEPRWGPAVAQAREACSADRQVGQVRLIGASGDRTAIIPTHRLGHWYVPIACSKL